MSGNKVPVRVFNPGSKPVLLKSGTLAARLQSTGSIVNPQDAETVSSAYEAKEEGGIL